MSHVRTGVDGGVAKIALDKPPLNILTIAMLTELAEAVRDAADTEGVHALVLRGEGKGFSAGVDVREHLPETIEAMLAAVHDALMAVLDAEARAGKTVIASTHDLASAADHFRSIVAVNGTIIAQGDASLVLDTDVLLKTYGGHLLFVGDRAVLIDDAHHHDEAPAGVVHHHDDEGGTPGRRP